jgi:citrate synthase
LILNLRHYVTVGVVGALSAFHNSCDIANPADRDVAAIKVISKMPTLAAIAYKTAKVRHA